MPIVIHLSINVDRVMPLDITLRTISLTVAARFVGDTCVKEGNLYQQLKMDNKLDGPVSTENVLQAALVFERYLWGEWSKGLAEKAMESITSEIADKVEETFQQAARGDAGASPSSSGEDTPWLLPVRQSHTNV